MQSFSLHFMPALYDSAEDSRKRRLVITEALGRPVVPEVYIYSATSARVFWFVWAGFVLFSAPSSRFVAQAGHSCLPASITNSQFLTHSRPGSDFTSAISCRRSSPKIHILDLVILMQCIRGEPTRLVLIRAVIAPSLLRAISEVRNSMRFSIMRLTVSPATKPCARKALEHRLALALSSVQVRL